MGEDKVEKSEKKLGLTGRADAFLKHWGEGLILTGGSIGMGGSTVELCRLALKYLGEGRPDQAIFTACMAAFAAFGTFVVMTGYTSSRKNG